MQDFRIVQEGNAFVVERGYRSGYVYGFTAVQGFPTREAAHAWALAQNYPSKRQSSETAKPKRKPKKCW